MSDRIGRWLPALLLAGMAAGGPSVSAQEAKQGQGDVIDTKFLRDLAETRGFLLGRPSAVKPTPDGKAVLFLRSPARSPVLHLYEFDAATRRTRELLTPEQLLKGAEEDLSPEEKARRERMRVTARGFTSFQLAPDGRTVLVSLSGKLYAFDRGTGKARELPTGKGTLLDPQFSPDGKGVAYVLDHDLYALDLATGKERRLTTGGTEDVTHGLAEFVAQEEMQRYGGFWWSPNSQWLAYEEADSRGVERWYVADPAKPGQAPHPQRYPRPGKANAQVRLGVLPARGGDTAWAEWDRERYPYLATVKWDKGGPLTILVQTRDQKEMVLLAADAKTGKTKELLREKDPAWLNLDPDVPRWLEDGSGFLWTSERDGGPRLEWRDAKGGLVRVLVEVKAGYVPGYAMRGPGLLGVDEKARQVYFRASTDPTQAHLYRASLDGGKPEKLSDEPGVYSAVFAKDFSLSVRQGSGPKAMPKAVVYGADGKPVAELPSVAEEPPFVPTTEVGSIDVPIVITRARALDGSVFEATAPVAFACSVTRPRDFDAKKKYSVIVDVYGGPTLRYVTSTMGRFLRPQWLADQGFVVVSMDGRGTPHNSRGVERSIQGSFGRVPLDDQVAILKELGKKHPEMDLGRVGITGWSFGGYLSALAVLRRPDVFKAAAAGAPVADWEDYDTHYTERYLGLPDQNKAGYKESSLLTYADKLQRPLLLIHGTGDDNVFFLHTLKLSEALFRAGKEHEVLPLSGLTHLVPDPTVKERLEERIVRFFRKHL